jgi:hypothetical protein
VLLSGHAGLVTPIPHTRVAVPLIVFLSPIDKYSRTLTPTFHSLQPSHLLSSVSRGPLISHNIRQIENYIFRAELSQKGTAPSFWNQESDRDKPGPTSTLSARGYDHLDAVIRTRENADHGVGDEELAVYWSSSLKVNHAIAHIRRTSFDLYRAILRVQNDPGIVQRWEDDAEADSPEWRRSYRMATREAARYIDALWPGTRLYIPSVAREDEQVASKLHARTRDNNDARRRDAWDRYFDLNAAIESITEHENCSLDAALGIYRDRLERAREPDVSPATFWRARDLVKTIRSIADDQRCTIRRAREIYKRHLEEKEKSASASTGG